MSVIQTNNGNDIWIITAADGSTITVDGTATFVNNLVGYALDVCVGGGASQWIFNDAVSFANTGAGNVNLFIGTLGNPSNSLVNSVGKTIFKGDVTFGPNVNNNLSYLSGDIIFDAFSTQTISYNSANNLVLNSSNGNVLIGSSNTPTVTVSGTGAGSLLVGNNLTVKANAILDLGNKILNRNTSGGIFTLNNGSVLKLGGSAGGQTGSNFPLNFSSLTIDPTSTVEYNALSTVNQTIFDVPLPGYGHLTLTNGTGSGATTKTAGGALDVRGNLTIGSNATFAAGTSLTHAIAGNWLNNGSFTFTTANTVLFNGANSATISGSSSTAFNNLSVDKGSSIATVLEATGPMSMNGNLTFTDGLFRLTHASSSAQPGGSLTIPSTAGIEINGGTLNPNFGSITNQGLFRVISGSATVGTSSGNAVNNQTGSTCNVQGGTLTVSGRLTATGGTVSQSGGTITLCTVGNTDAGTANFDISSTSNLSLTGGSVVFSLPNTATTPYNSLNIVSGRSEEHTSELQSH